MSILWFVLLVLGSYLLGSLPVHYMAAKLSRGIDLRKYGTSQVGAGNLWRMTRSWKIALPIGIFDICKGMVMVWAAQAVGLGIAQQTVVGLAAIVGHNWSVFLHFSGGRGIGTTLGVILIVPLINSLTSWDVITCAGIIIAGTVILRSSPLPVFLALIAVPIVSWRLNEPLEITLGFLAIFVIVIIKRVATQRPAVPNVTKGQLLLNRLLFDRDIRDRKAWMYRKPAREGKQEGDLV